MLEPRIPIPEVHELLPEYGWALWDAAVRAQDPRPAMAPTTSVAFDAYARRARPAWLAGAKHA